ncbi:MAG: peptidoglycan DD-metalloendopeptidase family protein [Salinivirgaceae bacterium]|jgi:septal ring factor EnvC (AmiA/AmiB activator)
MKLFYIILFLYPLILFSQTREELEKQRIATEAEIKYTNELIVNTERNKKTSYNKVLLINSKINNRKEIISTIEKEIQYLTNSILNHQNLIELLEDDLDSLKNDYANIIYYSYLSRNSNNRLMFILASENINIAYKRMKYYQQYTRFRKEQANNIILSKNKLAQEMAQLEVLVEEKNNLLSDKREESFKLLTEKEQKDKEIKLLSGKEKDLRNKLKAQYDLSSRLQKEIQRIIEEETKKAAELLKKKNTGKFQLTPDELLIADIFAKNQSKLPWPTVRGTITGVFGEQSHPFLSGVKIQNNGIDISTNEGAIVRSVYEGTISEIFFLPGAHKTIIIRHGNYCTVYSNLKEVFVKKGDKVSTKQNIGVVYTENDTDHKTVLQFQIWREKEKLNPEDWLAKLKNG